MTMTNARKRHATILKRRGVPYFQAHELRDIYASIMAKRCVKPATLAYLLGHKDEKTTWKYYKRATRDGIKAARKFMSAI